MTIHQYNTRTVQLAGCRTHSAHKELARNLWAPAQLPLLPVLGWWPGSLGQGRNGRGSLVNSLPRHSGEAWAACTAALEGGGKIHSDEGLTLLMHLWHQLGGDPPHTL